jgi:hypothetical protein
MEDSMVVDILESGRNESLAKKSPNGRYRVAAAQADLALADRDQILWVAELTRPNNPSVSNDGTVAVENWGAADSRELESAFFVIDRNGSALIEREYEANSLASGISKDGKLAWYTTAHADSEDGNKVFVYDLEERKRLLKAELPLRGVEKVEAEGDLVRVYIDGLECEYREGELGRSAEEHYHPAVMYGEEIFHRSICHGILSTPCPTEPFASRPTRSWRN